MEYTAMFLTLAGLLLGTLQLHPYFHGVHWMYSQSPSGTGYHADRHSNQLISLADVFWVPCRLERLTILGSLSVHFYIDLK